MHIKEILNGITVGVLWVGMESCLPLSFVMWNDTVHLIHLKVFHQIQHFCISNFPSCEISLK